MTTEQLNVREEQGIGLSVRRDAAANGWSGLAAQAGAMKIREKR
jgi:hypothetical protein